jgi:hypothetical protein
MRGFTDSLTKRTDPSQNRKLHPAGCRHVLKAEVKAWNGMSGKPAGNGSIDDAFRTETIEAWRVAERLPEAA